VRREIELARSRAGRTSKLAGLLREARERVDAFKAGGEGRALAGHGKLRDLEHERELAEVRLQRAQAAPAAEPAETEAPDALEADLDDEDRGGGTPAWPL
jgi:hypothetical protein